MPATEENIIVEAEIRSKRKRTKSVSKTPSRGRSQSSKHVPSKSGSTKRRKSKASKRTQSSKRK